MNARGALEVLLYFLRLGVTGFGGPLAIVAQMQRDLVEERRWISQDEFQQAFTLMKALPGAVAFNSAAYFGRRRAGILGAAAAGVGLIAPAFVAILIFAYSYSALADSVLVDKLLLGMQAAALALIIAALKPLTGKSLTSIPFWILVLTGAAVFATREVPEPALILAGGFGVLAFRRWRAKPGTLHSVVVGPAAIPLLFWICFKAGAFVFGTGIAIAPMLQADFVERLGWVTHEEFMDALAIGQITPGPVLITATFLGDRVAGVWGALVATIGVFLAGFIHMATWFPGAVTKLSKTKWIDDFLFGALAMVVGAILVTVVVLGSAPDWRAHPLIYLISAVVLGFAMKTKAPSWSLIVGGALAGVVLLG